MKPKRSAALRQLTPALVTAILIAVGCRDAAGIARAQARLDLARSSANLDEMFLALRELQGLGVKSAADELRSVEHGLEVQKQLRGSVSDHNDLKTLKIATELLALYPQHIEAQGAYKAALARQMDNEIANRERADNGRLKRQEFERTMELARKGVPVDDAQRIAEMEGYTAKLDAIEERRQWALKRSHELVFGSEAQPPATESTAATKPPLATHAGTEPNSEESK